MRLILIEHKPLGQVFVESEYVVIALSQCGLEGVKRLHLPPNISLTELESTPWRTTLFNQNMFWELLLECTSANQEGSMTIQNYLLLHSLDLIKTLGSLELWVQNPEGLVLE